MKLPDQRKIVREDIKTKESWVSSLIDPINRFMDTVYIAMNKNLTFQENIRAIVKDVALTTTSLYPVMDPIEFQNTLSVKATGLIVVQAYKRADYTPVMEPVYASWVEDNGTIVISALSGLDIETDYTVRFLVF